MTDVPPGTGGPGDGPGPYVPPGPRRSTYTPPPAGTEPPAFDDDALADALAAQVAPYTAPVPVTPPPTAAPEPDAAPAASPESSPESSPAASPESSPATPAEAIPTPAVDTSVSPTLEAIERLEQELRRRADEARAVASGSLPVPTPDATGPAPFATGPAPLAPPPDAPLFPAPPTYLRPAPPEEEEAPAPVVLPEPPAAPEPPAPEPPTWDAPAAPAEPESPADAPHPADLAPPPLVEPPAFAPPPAFPPPTGAPAPFAPPPGPVFGAPPSGPVFGAPPSSAPIDLPPPEGAPVDIAHLPPPVGLEPAPLPPYDPADDPAATHAPTGPAVDLPPPPGEDDEAVDDVDRVFGTGAIAVDSTGSITVPSPPSQPIPTVRLADDEPALVGEEPRPHPALVVETAGPEPTALDLRAGRAARMFWMWFAANSSVLSLGLGAVLFGLGMSLRQAVLSVLFGVVLSFLPLGLGTLAGKWSGQPTMIVSRAAFGVVGNVLPALLAVVSRVLWGGALLWVLAAGVGRVLADAGLDAGLGEQTWTLVALGAASVLVGIVAIFGYGLLARVQLVLSILTGVLVIGLMVLTAPRIDLAAAASVRDGPWTLLLSGAVLVFSFVGLAWVHTSADLARYQRPDRDGAWSMLWASLGATLPAFLLVSWGAVLAASDPRLAEGLATNPLRTIAAILPIWYPAPLLGALALGLLSGAVLTVYSGGFALQSLGLRVRRAGTTAIAAALVIAAALALVLLVGGVQGLLRDVVTTLAVPVAAWAGIFTMEMMLRKRRFHPDSLLRRGGVYPAVRWVNLVGLVLISAVGLGLTSAALPGLDWQGYLLPFLGLPGDDPLVTGDIGVLVALVLGLLLPAVTGVPAIRRQEDASVD